VTAARGRGQSIARYTRWLAGPALLVVVWQVAVASNRWPSALVPGPADVGETLWDMARSGELRTNAWASVRRVLVGLAVGTFAGLLVGLAASSKRRAAWPLYELVELGRPIPPIAWIPLAIAWFGIGYKAAVAVVTVGVFFPFAIACANAFANAHVAVDAVVSMFGLRGRDALRLAVPAAIPEIASAFRLAVGFGWTSVIAAELVSGQTGLGYLIQQSRLLLQMDKVVACMIVIGVIGFALTWIATRVELRALRRWRPDVSTAGRA
jgi:NitT/TauT family transport system permease protein/sulfonate transport system permease protein